MRITCLDDRGGWGRQLYDAAAERGHHAHLIPHTSSFLDTVDDPDIDHYVFMRLAQEADRLAIEKSWFEALHRRGYQLIPDYHIGIEYEDKWLQTIRYGNWMPSTVLIKDPDTAAKLAQRFRYPFISKSKTGSASRNVRIVQTPAQAMQEVSEAFFAQDGIQAPHKMGELYQQGYLIWQEFLNENEHDLRVVITGSKMMALKRFNKPGTKFASGSGLNCPANLEDPEVQRALDTAGNFFAEFNTRWAGIDMVRDPTTLQWKILETTLGWSHKAYLDCQYVETEFTGKDIWQVTLNEIEKGVFYG